MPHSVKRPRPQSQENMARPRKKLNTKLVRQLAQAQLTTPEIATICGCSADTIERRFAGSLKAWKDEGVGSVRRELFITAMGKSKGKVSSMIFYLKNYGGMSDKHEVTGPDGGPIQHQNLDKLTDEQLQAAEAIVESAFAGGHQG